MFSPPSLPPVLHHTLCSALHLIYPLHLFRFCRAPTLRVSLTLSLLSPVPSSPHVTPISVSPVCFLTARQSFLFSFFLPRTRQYQNSAELLWRMGVFFFFFSRSGSVSVCEVTYSDKAPGGGVCCHRPVTMGQTHGGGGERGGASLSKGPASFNKASVIPCLKRPPFLYLSPPLSLSWLNAGKSTSLPKPCREINACRRGEGGGNVERRLRTTQCHWTVTWAKTSRGIPPQSTVLSLDSDGSSAAKECGAGDRRH